MSGLTTLLILTWISLIAGWEKENIKRDAIAVDLIETVYYNTSGVERDNLRLRCVHKMEVKSLLNGSDDTTGQNYKYNFTVRGSNHTCQVIIFWQPWTETRILLTESCESAVKRQQLAELNLLDKLYFKSSYVRRADLQILSSTRHSMSSIPAYVYYGVHGFVYTYQFLVVGSKTECKVSVLSRPGLGSARLLQETCDNAVQQYLLHMQHIETSSIACGETFCGAGRQCVNDTSGDPVCVCRDSCPLHVWPVCGSDGATYLNHCQMHREACIKSIKIRKQHKSKCTVASYCLLCPLRRVDCSPCNARSFNFSQNWHEQPLARDDDVLTNLIKMNDLSENPLTTKQLARHYVLSHPDLVLQTDPQHPHYNHIITRNRPASVEIQASKPSTRSGGNHISLTDEVGCKTSSVGWEYIGSMSATSHGVPCTPWTGRPLHSHYYKDADFPDGSAKAASSFCRNPWRDPAGPWCDTDVNDVGQWGYCDVPLCEDLHESSGDVSSGSLSGSGEEVSEDDKIRGTNSEDKISDEGFLMAQEKANRYSASGSGSTELPTSGAVEASGEVDASGEVEASGKIEASGEVESSGEAGTSDATIANEGLSSGEMPGSEDVNKVLDSQYVVSHQGAAGSALSDLINLEADISVNPSLEHVASSKAYYEDIVDEAIIVDNKHAEYKNKKPNADKTEQTSGWLKTIDDIMSAFLDPTKYFNDSKQR